MFNRFIGNTALSMSFIALAGLASMSSVASNISRISESRALPIEPSGHLSVPVPALAPALAERVQLKAKRNFELEAGETVKLAQDNGATNTRCQVTNAGRSVASLAAQRTVGALSIGGGKSGQLHHDWQFSLPHTRLLFHCEFPNGVNSARAHEEAGKALRGHFEIQLPKT